MFKMDYVGILKLVFIYFISHALCQDRILLSHPNFDESNTITSQENGTEIPETLLIQLKDVRNMTDLQRFIAGDDDIHDNGFRLVGGRNENYFEMNGHSTASRRKTPVSRAEYGLKKKSKALKIEGSASRSSRRKISVSRGRAPSNVIAKPADCKPEEHTIELDKPENGATLYWPSCVRVKRCGGCCTSKLLECKPLATSILTVRVLQLHYNHENRGSLENQGTKVFSVEEHTRCACTCKEGPEHCDPEVHDYRADECRCACKNYELSTSCSGPKKIWDSRSCMCKCRNSRMCSSGRYFDILTCRCKVLPSENLNT